MAWRQEGRSAGTWNIVQTPKGRKAAAKKLFALNPLTVVMEATGIYYLDLAIELATAGFPVSVLTPPPP